MGVIGEEQAKIGLPTMICETFVMYDQLQAL